MELSTSTPLQPQSQASAKNDFFRHPPRRSKTRSIYCLHNTQEHEEPLREIVCVNVSSPIPRATSTATNTEPPRPTEICALSLPSGGHLASFPKRWKKHRERNNNISSIYARRKQDYTTPLTPSELPPPPAGQLAPPPPTAPTSEYNGGDPSLPAPPPPPPRRAPPSPPARAPARPSRS